MQKYKWPLSVNDVNFWDRLRICWFFLNKKYFWTQNKFVKAYEECVRKYIGVRYAVFVSSGSTANSLICQRVKDLLVEKGEWPKKNKVILGGISWQTNASYWIREGFDPSFLDVNLTDFSFDYDKLEEYVKNNHQTIACIFPTVVLGFPIDINRLQDIGNKYKVEIKLDGCECFGTTYLNKNMGYQDVLKPFTSTTSTFFAHILNNNMEGGFVFTNDIEEYKYFLLARAHGLIRNLEFYKEKFGVNDKLEYPHEEIQNKLVDKQFDFNTLSGNCRNTEIGAITGLLNFEKIYKNKNHRIKTYKLFYDNIDKEKYHLPEFSERMVAFCLPIIINKNNKNLEIPKIKGVLLKNSIEVRSFISGNMLRQRPYQKYGDYKKLENSEYLNNKSCYIGINSQLKEKDIIFVTDLLNKL